MVRSVLQVAAPPTTKGALRVGADHPREEGSDQPSPLGAPDEVFGDCRRVPQDLRSPLGKPCLGRKVEPVSDRDHGLHRHSLDRIQLKFEGSQGLVGRPDEER